MEDGPVAWTLLAILISAFLYKRFLVFTRDVPEEYLNEQSIIDSTRNQDESAIHKSTKLDYSSGLRVGLGIRYAHYKLRNGNLYDIWEIAMGHVKKNQSKSIFFDHIPVKLSLLNGLASQFQSIILELSKSEVIDEICIHTNLLFTDPEVLAVIIACFTFQITVHIHDGSHKTSAESSSVHLKKHLGDIFLIRGTKNLVNLKTKVDKNQEKTDFENEYTFEKDRGIAVRISHQVNHRAVVCTDFTQSNLVSSVASCIKHLPPQHQMTSSDRMLLVQDKSSIEGVANTLVKILVTLVTGTELYISSNLATGIEHRPTIISAENEVVQKLAKEPKGIDKLLQLHRLYSLSCNRFSALIFNKPYPDLRLVIAHRSITSAQESPDWRKIRASLVTQVVEEIGYFNVAGPLIVSDLFDYRKFASGVSSQTLTHGAVAQSNEIKLVEFDGKNSGKLSVRGYNIGKAKTIMENVGETLILPDTEGFYQLPVRARWGSDGCIYVMKQ
ncbi:hypothetical protein JCM33374_g2144 [Metschnikowia sp. JCM 33374]|nr:hypothetical protein JCM33374_g2144 [Metschnikowia sp. JCM 33374]